MRRLFLEVYIRKWFTTAVSGERNWDKRKHTLRILLIHLEVFVHENVLLTYILKAKFSKEQMNND